MSPTKSLLVVKTQFLWPKTSKATAPVKTDHVKQSRSIKSGLRVNLSQSSQVIRPTYRFIRFCSHSWHPKQLNYSIVRNHLLNILRGTYSKRRSWLQHPQRSCNTTYLQLL